jgi:hypothetical protein
MVLTSAGCLAQDSKPYRPDFIEAKFAGSVGQYSIGVGYDVFRKKGRTSIHLGHVLKGSGGPLTIVAAKLFYSPLVVKVNDDLTWWPVDFGVKVSYHFGEPFYIRWPDRYPKGYYWWNSAIRMHLAIESSLEVTMPEDSRFRTASAFIQFNTNDLYLVSYITNVKSIHFLEIVKAGIGARVFFR